MIRTGYAISLATLLVIFSFSHSVNGLAAPKSPQEVSKDNSQVTFNRDIASILFQHCAACHRPGESGPFSLLSYKDAKSHARQIAAVTQSRFMPPWLPEPGVFKFADELRLSDAQIATIAHWVEQGALEGAPSDLPPSEICRRLADGPARSGYQCGKAVPAPCQRQ
jgi:mono/diheme cytochrome c family protein